MTTTQWNAGAKKYDFESNHVFFYVDQNGKVISLFWAGSWIMWPDNETKKTFTVNDNTQCMVFGALLQISKSQINSGKYCYMKWLCCVIYTVYIFLIFGSSQIIVALCVWVWFVYVFFSHFSLSLLSLRGLSFAHDVSMSASFTICFFLHTFLLPICLNHTSKRIFYLSLILAFSLSCESLDSIAVIGDLFPMI